MTDRKWCLACDEPSTIDAFRCSNCGNGQFAEKSREAFLKSDSSSSWLKEHFQAMGVIGKAVSVIFAIYNVFAVISLFGGSSSPDDLSKCNGTYDTAIYLKYGVFRCPAIYDQTGSSFDSAGLVALIFFDAFVFGILYFYAKRKLKR